MRGLQEAGSALAKLCHAGPVTFHNPELSRFDGVCALGYLPPAPREGGRGRPTAGMSASGNDPRSRDR